MISCITLVIGIFSDSVRVYEPNNTGGWYDFGFVLGVASVWGAGHRAGTTSRKRRDAEWEEIGRKVEAKLKRMIRASVAHSFLPGTRLRELTGCKNALRRETLDAACEAALGTSERAALEWKVEAALDEFERNLVD